MSTKALFERLKGDFGLIPIAFYNHIAQNGDYVILSGFNRKNPNTKIINLKVLFVRNTLDREVYTFLDEIASFEDKIFKIEAALRAEILSDMSVQAISEGQFAYIFTLNVPLKKVW